MNILIQQSLNISDQEKEAIETLPREVQDFVIGYKQLVKDTGVRLISNDYDDDCFVSYTVENKCLGYMGELQNGIPTFDY